MYAEARMDKNKQKYKNNILHYLEFSFCLSSVSSENFYHQS